VTTTPIRRTPMSRHHERLGASIEVEARDGERTVRILFSADIGPDYKLLHPDPTEHPRSSTGNGMATCESENTSPGHASPSRLRSTAVVPAGT